MASSLTPQEFVSKWRQSELKERSAYLADEQILESLLALTLERSAAAE